MNFSSDMQVNSVFRNIFHFDEEAAEWKEVLANFPNKVPRFETKEEALDFTKSYCKRGSNPDTPHLLHSVTTLITWDQICNHLLPRIKEYYEKWPSVGPSASVTATNRFTTGSGANKNESELNERGDGSVNEGLLYDYLTSRLDLSIHREMSIQSTINTLKYMFFHMKCGIFVMIRNNQVVIFCPFVNKDYKNSWQGALKVGSSDGTISTYYEDKRDHYRKENVIENMDEWWANGNIICNEYSNESLGNQFWGDHFLLQLKDMFAETCNHREVPDCEFFINKRDYPHLKFNPDIAGGIPVEPYGFIFDKDDRDPEADVPLNQYFYKSYAPIMSFYTSRRFADIPIPPSEDWESATGQVFPSSFIHTVDDSGNVVPGNVRDLFTAANLKKFACAWEAKVSTAFFRGTATGGGTTADTNQRIHIAQLCHDWSKIPELNGENPELVNSSGGGGGGGGVGHAYLDAKITGWNLRDKKIATKPMTHVRPCDFPFEGDRKKNFVEIYKQSTYKYLVYVEGHCAACRYGFMMQLGSVILKVDSMCVADQMWYFPLLQPYYDHVPVKADLSDLQSQLEWCHSHDEECKIIAANAQTVYRKFISRDGILDYLQITCQEIAKRWRRTSPSWCPSAPKAHAVPQLTPAQMQGNSGSRYCSETHDGLAFCSYCEAMKKRDAEEKLLMLEQNHAAGTLLKRQLSDKQDYKAQQRKMLKSRMKEKAVIEKKQQMETQQK